MKAVQLRERTHLIENLTFSASVRGGDDKR